MGIVLIVYTPVLANLWNFPTLLKLQKSEPERSTNQISSSRQRSNNRGVIIAIRRGGVASVVIDFAAVAYNVQQKKSGSDQVTPTMCSNCPPYIIRTAKHLTLTVRIGSGDNDYKILRSRCSALPWRCL